MWSLCYASNLDIDEEKLRIPGSLLPPQKSGLFQFITKTKLFFFLLSGICFSNKASLAVAKYCIGKMMKEELQIKNDSCN
jgi:hypothetical protein